MPLHTRFQNYLKKFQQNFVKSMANEIIPNALNSVFHITPEDENKLKSTIKEALPKFLKKQNIIDGVDQLGAKSR